MRVLRQRQQKAQRQWQHNMSELANTAAAIASRAALATQADTSTGVKNSLKMGDKEARDWAQGEHDTRSQYELPRKGRR